VAGSATTINNYPRQASIGYAFDLGLNVDLGWKHIKESDVITARSGCLLTHALGHERRFTSADLMGLYFNLRKPCLSS
jgi:hypothetical protein